MVQGNLSIREGNLITELPVVLLELSSDGCLIECREEIAEHAEGELDLRIEGHASRDEVRIIRCRSAQNASGGYRIAAKFVGAVSQHDSAFPRTSATDS